MEGRIVAALVMVAVISFAAGYVLARSSGTAAPPNTGIVAGIVVLNDREYYPRLLATLSKANKSIHISMFMFKMDNDVVERIAEILIAKSRQGVDVRVVMEDSLDYNELAYRRLRDAGVPVRFDSRAHTTHTKLVIVDGKIVFVGSHNFSYSAMERNHEASVMILDPAVAKAEEEYFEEIWRSG